MAATWELARTADLGGRFQLIITKPSYGGARVDATEFRGVPTAIASYTDGDPFGDSTAVFTFPAITVLDDLSSPELHTWLDYYSDVDLYWVPAVEMAPQYSGVETPVISPATGRPTVITPTRRRNADGVVVADARVKLWEGFITSFDWSSEANSSGLTVTCQGALFQLDRYRQKPFYPVEPWPLEALIEDAFSHEHKPHLRTMPLRIDWPDGWARVIPPFTHRDIYTPVGRPGTLFTGYASRQTGSWDHALTGFVQDQLTNMITDEKSGVEVGNQWTVVQDHASQTAPGRQPVLTVRDRFRAPDLSVWAGQPGVTLHLSGDSTQVTNIAYGEGTGVDGTKWRNAVISNDGSRTDYVPLAALREVYPPRDNPAYVRAAFASEAYLKFDTGFDLLAAESVAMKMLGRNANPGLTGSITLKVDPVEMPRWQVRSGMTILVKGLLGSGETGIPLHIAARSAKPSSGTVELTVDSRYRDLLTVEQAHARTRDPLTPVRMLQVNRASVMVEDIQAPWDYSAGSGYIPKASQGFFDTLPASVKFPYVDWVKSNPPRLNPTWYVKCEADADTRKARWAGPVSVLTSEKGTIIRTEMLACDIDGNPLPVPFHLSFYYVNVDPTAMPRDGGGPSPFIDGAFERRDPATGQQTSEYLWPDDSFIVGWGNMQDGVYNRAGFWPGRESDGGLPTGLLVDSTSWSFDNTQYSQYFKANNPPGKRPKASDITIYAMVYCEADQPVYFIGRLFRQNQGAS